MLTIVCFGILWVNKVSISFLQQLDLKNKNLIKIDLDLSSFELAKYEDLISSSYEDH